MGCCASGTASSQGVVIGGAPSAGGGNGAASTGGVVIGKAPMPVVGTASMGGMVIGKASPGSNLTSTAGAILGKPDVAASASSAIGVVETASAPGGLVEQDDEEDTKVYSFLDYRFERDEVYKAIWQEALTTFEWMTPAMQTVDYWPNGKETVCWAVGGGIITYITNSMSDKDASDRGLGEDLEMIVQTDKLPKHIASGMQSPFPAALLTLAGIVLQRKGLLAHLSSTAGGFMTFEVPQAAEDVAEYLRFPDEVLVDGNVWFAMHQQLPANIPQKWKLLDKTCEFVAITLLLPSEAVALKADPQGAKAAILSGLENDMVSRYDRAPFV